MVSLLAQADLRSLFNSVPDAIFIHDLEGALINVNDRAVELFQVSREELLECGLISDLSSAQNQSEAFDQQWQRACKGEVVKFEWIARRPHDDSCFDAEMVLRRITLSGADRLMINVRDISDRKAAEAALIDSQHRFQKLSGNLPGMIYQCRLDPEGEFSFPYVSAACEEIYGYTPAQIYADAALLLGSIHPDDVMGFEVSIGLSAESLTQWTWEGRIVSKSGEVTWVGGHSRPERQADGAIIWDGILLDISDRKRAEQRLQDYANRRELVHQLTTQIRNSLDLDIILQTAITQIQQFLAVDSCAFAWLESAVKPVQLALVAECLSPSCNRSLASLSDKSVGCIDETLLSQKLLIVNDAETYREFGHRQFLKGAGIRSELMVVVTTEDTRTGVIICTQFSGLRRWALNEVSLIQSVSDQLAIATSQAQLYAHSRQQADELSCALAQLKNTQAQIIQTEKMSSLGRMVAGVAHEINNPVNFIHANLKHSRTYVSDLLKAVCLYRQHCLALPAEVQETIEELDIDFLEKDFFKLVDSMQVGTERIREIVLSLRNFSRLDEADSKVVDIHEGIDNTLLILSNQIHHDKIEIVKKYQPIPKVECYPGQLNQAILNLLGNAIDALKELLNQDAASPITAPKITPKIIIATAIERDVAVIAIANNGPPIESSIQQKIFDPFFTTKPVGQGTGLGLAIAHQIITQNHKGQLTLTSNTEQTTFTLKLPLSL